MHSSNDSMVFDRTLGREALYIATEVNSERDERMQDENCSNPNKEEGNPTSPGN